MSLDMSQFIPTFLEESFEGIALMEQSLLSLEPGDDDTINAIFRAAHSIKGGAGTFGFKSITEFTHLVETFLDEMRNHKRDITKENIELMLISVDCIRLLVEAARDEQECNDDLIEQTTKKLSDALNVSQKVEKNINKNEENSSAGGWNIKFVPHETFLHTGNDPLFIFNALADFGVLTVNCHVDKLTSLAELDAEKLFLYWNVELITQADEVSIREIFEWVEDDCELQIEPISTTKKPQVKSHGKTDNSILKDTVLVANNVSATDSEAEKVDVNVKDTAAKVAKKPSVSNESSSIRVGVDKVDNLINLVGELVITQSMLTELGSDFDMTKLERLHSGLEQLLNNTKELQESVMRIRMLPISFAFNRFPRLVRDLSAQTGKNILLEMHGENTELDKTVMEQIGDPLVHLVRNAIDHGIESEEIRTAAGKSSQGLIRLDAYHQGGSIIVEVSDDGGGIDKDAVRNKAIERRLIDASVDLSDSQIYDLLFEPGFSTAKEVSDISGRGVGMDVVRSNIQALGGSIQIESTKGKGSKFKVQLPLTLAILDGQLVKVGTETYIIPLLAIVESLQIKAEHVNTISGNIMLYRLRDDNVPIIPIYQHFNINSRNTELDDALLVVVEANDQKIGLLVDDLLAQQQVVIKSLKENYKQVEGISGATILGDGSVSLILDIPSLIASASKRSFRKSKTFKAA